MYIIFTKIQPDENTILTKKNSFFVHEIFYLGNDSNYTNVITYDNGLKLYDVLFPLPKMSVLEFLQKHLGQNFIITNFLWKTYLLQFQHFTSQVVVI